MLKQARLFFELRHVTEVDCPILTRYAPIDAHILLIEAYCRNGEIRYLHSSPEYGMKRLLVEGSGDIYQLSHVFRDEESGPKHNPEFMMAEWYRTGFSIGRMIEETLAFIRIFLGELPSRTMSYRALFLQMTGIDYTVATEAELFSYIENGGISFYPGIVAEGKDALLNLILGTEIEPLLGGDELFVLTDYPASQAALAKKTVVDSVPVAERFEVYYRGIELANGYHELGDPVEQRFRFSEANRLRAALGEKTLPPDEFFLRALEKGLPDCSGVAVGFDRLMMLRQNRDRIEDTVPQAWDIA